MKHPLGSHVAAFRASPEIQALINPPQFEVAATVESDIVQYEAGYHYASSDHIQGMWVRSIRPRDGRVLWLFQNDEDAILFAFMFGGEIRTPVPLNKWLAQRP